MGKQLHRDYSSMRFDGSNRGCLPGVFHILYFHQWHNVRRMLPHKKHSHGRQPEGFKCSKKDQHIPTNIEAQDSTDGEVDKLIFEEKIEETSSTNEKSGKAQIKTLIAEEISKERDQKCRSNVFPAKVRLLRTNSIHHLEPSPDDKFFEDIREKDDDPRINDRQYDVMKTGTSKLVPVMQKPPETDFRIRTSEMCETTNAENELGHAQVDELRMQLTQNHPLLRGKLGKGVSKQKYMDAKFLIREDSLAQSKKFLDVLEVFQVNKELFLKTLHEPESSPENDCQNVQISNTERELTKSSSFPAPYSSCKKTGRLANLKNNLKEVKSFTKQEGQLQAGSLPLDSSHDIITGLMADHDEPERLGTAGPSEDSDCSLGSSHALKNQGDNLVVTNRFKNIKQRMKHATEGSEKEHRRISMDAILHKITIDHKHPKDGKEMSDHWNRPITDRDFKDSASSIYDKGGVRHLRRTASLSESMDRFSQLFGSTFNRESKHHSSNRLRLTNEDVGYAHGPAPKAFGRMLSLPEIKSPSSLVSEVDISCLGMPAKIYVDSPAKTEISRSDQQESADLPVCVDNDSELEPSIENADQEILDEVSQSISGGDEVELMLNTDDKEKEKHATECSEKEHHRISMDATLHQITIDHKCPKDVKEVSDHWKRPKTDRDFKDSTSSSYGKGGLHHLRRTASLSESLDGYSQLLDSTFSREAKQHPSDRLRLTNEDVGYASGPALKTFGRLLSLPEIKSSCSLVSELDTSCLGMPSKIYVDSPAKVEMSRSDQQKFADLPVCVDDYNELEASVENANQEILVEASESISGEDEVGLMLNTDDDGEANKMNDNLSNQPMLENSSTSHHQQEVKLATDSCINQTQQSPSSVLDSWPLETFIMEEVDSGLKLKHIDINELGSLNDMPYANGGMTEIENVTTLSKHFDSCELPRLQVDKTDEAVFNFVRDVIKLSGFCGDENQALYLPGQAIDPSLFEEVDCCRQDTVSNCDHQLLFDVVNEVLLGIYERSFKYWPRPLSNNLNIRPLPDRFHALEEVWASVRWLLKYQPQSDLSLDDIASRDLAKADGWMNLEYESECVGLELEEWIWDDLLEEVILELEVP